MRQNIERCPPIANTAAFNMPIAGLDAVRPTKTARPARPLSCAVSVVGPIPQIGMKMGRADQSASRLVSLGYGSQNVDRAAVRPTDGLIDR